MNKLEHEFKNGNKNVVYICDDTMNKIKNLVKEIVAEKQKEALHQYDNRKEEERWITGLMGERAVEVITGLKIIDWEAGPSETYRSPDMENAGYDLGIKTIKVTNQYPLIPRHNKTAQIICQRDGNYIKICGIATVTQLNTHQDDSFVYDYHIKGRKTCFTGMNYLTDIKYIDMFKK